MDFIISADHDIWNIILDVPTIPAKIDIDRKTRVPKGRLELTPEDKTAVQNNTKEKKILIFEIGPDEYN